MSLSTEQRAMRVALRAILERVEKSLEDLPNRRSSSHCFDLEDLPDRVSTEMRDGATKRLQRLLLTVARRLLEVERSNGSGPSSQVLMRDLTGVWLGLYFLGTPFPQPWEPVARHAERNGYYRDGGIFKAAGDVYRAARRKQGDASSASAKPLLLFDRRPLAYFKLVEEGRKSGADLTAIVTALGACYEMLQLRLYIGSEGSIEHVVLRDTLRELVRKDTSNVVAMVKLATHAYGSLPSQSTSRQRITIVEGEEESRRLTRLGGCVLGPEEGVYRSLLTGNDGANGDRLPDVQHDLYRKALEAALQATSGLHPVQSDSDLRTYLEDLAHDSGPAAAEKREAD
jgi:hypothetical protein